MLQRFYQGCYYFGLWGMNYGVSSDLRKNGEQRTMKFLIKKFGWENPVIFDVGANLGDYALALRSSFPNAYIYCFEPVKSTYAGLLQNVGSDRLIKSCNIGLGDVQGNVTIHYNPAMLSRSTISSQSHQEFTQSETIEIQTLDAFCSGAGISQIDFLKIDVEGHELKVLNGAKRLLKEQRITCIQFEFGGTQIAARTFFKDFWDLLNQEYHIYRILSNDLLPISRYSEGLEVFHYSNFLALEKGTFRKT